MATSASVKKSLTNLADGSGNFSQKAISSTSSKAGGTSLPQRTLVFEINSPKNFTHKPISVIGKSSYKNAESSPKNRKSNKIEAQKVNGPYASSQSKGINSTKVASFKPAQNFQAALVKSSLKITPEYSEKSQSPKNSESQASTLQIHPSPSLRTNGTKISVSINSKIIKNLQIITDCDSTATTLPTASGTKTSPIRNQTPKRFESANSPKISTSFDVEQKGLLKSKTALNRTENNDSNNWEPANVSGVKYTHHQSGPAYEESAKNRRMPGRGNANILNKLLSEISQKHSSPRKASPKENSTLSAKEKSGSRSPSNRSPGRSQVKQSNISFGFGVPSNLNDDVKDKKKTNQSFEVNLKGRLQRIESPILAIESRNRLEQVSKKSTPEPEFKKQSQVSEQSLQVLTKDSKIKNEIENEALGGFITRVNPGDSFMLNALAKIKTRQKQLPHESETITERKTFFQKPQKYVNAKLSRYGLDDDDEEENTKTEEQPKLTPKSESTSTSQYRLPFSAVKRTNATTSSSQNNSHLNSSQESKSSKSQSNSVKASSSFSKLEKCETKGLSLKANSPSPFLYYAGSLKKHLRSPDANDYFCQIYREHLLQTYQSLMFTKFVKPVDSKVLNSKKINLPKRPGFENKKTIIFDLDETLVHCNDSTALPYDVKLPIKFPNGEIMEAGINIRPYAIECLKELSQIFEIIVFTASHSCYGDQVLNWLDPQREYIHHRLFRESCVQTEEGLYIKDLRVIANRDLSQTVLVDNAAYSFGFQIENGIPIIPFYENKNDKELLHLTNYLKYLEGVEDVREINKQTFNLLQFRSCETPTQLIEKLRSDF